MTNPMTSNALVLPPAKQLELLGDAQPAPVPGGDVIHVGAYVRRSRRPVRAVGGTREPLPASAVERNRWVLARLEEWRKADHAASQQRCEGRKHNRAADVCEGAGMFADEHLLRERAEACFALAGQHETRAAGIILQITERVR